ncbi:MULTISPECIES: class I SAM-dependent methyltransferase [unclassified Rummeliibacillus]|uniref:class I SAM-dependent methyltransferase n=1 Tax=unclassified Rummeliibacillus TaxID=2622809 RepID=UPI000E66D1B8|nr:MULTISPECIES: class I SAM-dependent methyltransferase [unclassified Rummeliibacillus]RIJ63411.1 methyltransferase domain-containing protein [Rummeliibacillus sp. POC4]RPJ94167.1 methyltransferase domain-containing protein [Rummeliibacillus sp. TYF005]
MKLQRVLQYAQFLLKETVETGDIVVDATAGNGYDTTFLAQLVGENGHVFAFDVQQQAIESTNKRLTEVGMANRVSTILDGHENVAQYVQQPISAAIFNLGYLPGSEHQIITKPNTTLQAIESLLKLLKVGGMIVLVVYYGHEGGKEERDQVIEYVSNLPQKKVHVLRYEFINQKNDPPFIIALEKVAEITNK